MREENKEYLTTQIITYLGNKRQLIGHIEEEVKTIADLLAKEKLVCADLFSGSGIVSRMLKKYSSFLLTGVDENVMIELASKLNKYKFIYDAGIISYIEKEHVLQYDKTVLVVTSLANDDKIIKELETVFNILGMPVEICSISKYETVPMQVVKNYISKAKAVIIAFDKDIRLTSIISNISKKPVILLSKNKNIEEYMLSNGAVLAKPGSAVSAVMAVKRIIG